MKLCVGRTLVYTNTTPPPVCPVFEKALGRTLGSWPVADGDASEPGGAKLCK